VLRALRRSEGWNQDPTLKGTALKNQIREHPNPIGSRHRVDNLDPVNLIGLWSRSLDLPIASRMAACESQRF